MAIKQITNSNPISPWDQSQFFEPFQNPRRKGAMLMSKGCGSIVAGM